MKCLSMPGWVKFNPMSGRLNFFYTRESAVEMFERSWAEVVECEQAPSAPSGSQPPPAHAMPMPAAKTKAAPILKTVPIVVAEKTETDKGNTSRKRTRSQVTAAAASADKRTPKKSSADGGEPEFEKSPPTPSGAGDPSEKLAKIGKRLDSLKATYNSTTGEVDSILSCIDSAKDKRDAWFWGQVRG